MPADSQVKSNGLAWNSEQRPLPNDFGGSGTEPCQAGSLTALQPRPRPGDTAYSEDCIDADRPIVSIASIKPLPNCRTERYGFGRFTPNWLQHLNTPASFLAFLCWFTFVQSFPINGLTNVNTTTLERRFRLTSAQVGFISGAYDVVGGLVVLPVSYCCSRGHKPRYLAIASLFIVAGSLVMLLPHVLDGPYRYTTTATTAAGHACAGSGNGTDMLVWTNGTSSLLKTRGCSATDGAAVGEVSRFFYVFLLGMGLIGCGGITLYTVGTVFIDENIPADRASLFTGIFFGFTSLGSAAGFLAGSRFLAVYVDAPAQPPTELTQEDPLWVGAWWMGYVVNIVLAAFLSIFLFGFPRELPSANEARRTRISEAHHHDTEAHSRAIRDPSFGTRIRDAPAATMLLLRNPAFMCITLAGVTDSLVKSGIAQFLAKFIQNQFNQTASWSAMLAGFIVVPGAAGGCVAGGWLPRRFGMKVRGLILLCLASSLAITALSASFWMRCDVTIMAGVTAHYSDSRGGGVVTAVSLTSPCNKGCHCATAAYSPVCGSDGLQYFSACHAGCATTASAGKLGNCSCIAASSSDATAAAANIGGQASVGKCQVDCPQLYAFLFVMFLAIFSVFLSLTPWTTASMRIVAESQRTYAVGFQWVFLRLAGLAPGPVVFGAIIDAACIVWQDKCSGGGGSERGSCWLYRGHDLSSNIFIAIVGLKIVSSTLYLCAFRLYRPPPAGQLAAAAAAADCFDSNGQVVAGSVVPLTTADEPVDG